MIVEDNSTDLKSFFNLEAFQKFISVYKFPLILSVIGIVFLIVGIVYILKSQNTSSEVFFSSADSTSSAKMGKVKIHIDIEGAVMSPGIYETEEGSRINSVLSQAGGLAASADREWVAKNLNLAAKLVDGGKIYIPSLAEASFGKSEIRNPKSENDLSNTNNLLGVTTEKVNINSASQLEIEGLPGVGPVTAVKIISNRPFQSVEELKSKKIVGNALYNKIKDLITL